jgi:hypothetical protein
MASGFMELNLLLYADPTKHPIVNPNYGGHPADISVLAAFLRWCALSIWIVPLDTGYCRQAAKVTPAG